MSLTDAQVAEIAGMTAGTSLGVRARELAQEVQELRHLRDNVLPDLREELGMANAYLAHSRALCEGRAAEILRLSDMIKEAGI